MSFIHVPPTREYCIPVWICMGGAWTPGWTRADRALCVIHDYDAITVSHPSHLAPRDPNRLDHGDIPIHLPNENGPNA